MALYDTVMDGVINFAMAKGEMTPKEIEDIVDMHLNLYSVHFPDETVDREALLKEVLALLDVTGGESTTLKDNKDHQEWLANEKADISWEYWKRYQLYLKKFEKYPPHVIESLDKSTDNVLKLLESPRRKGSWDRRGMVVGNIQSGKTSNYTGVICKAVDAGYKVVIVLAGLNNDLRSQTQKRIDKGFLGRDTSKKNQIDQTSSAIGAGSLSMKVSIKTQAVTSSDTNGDYKSSVHKGISIVPGGDPVIAVVKKNVTPLNNLLDWLKSINESGSITDVPLLLIDDEADNASIDTNAEKQIGNGKYADDDKENDPTTINGLIRKILKCFDQSAYIGYTATPFANVFIHPSLGNDDKNEFGEDLFPRSFIVNLHAPSNYMGPDKVFGLQDDKFVGIEEQEPLPLVRKINDYQDIFPEKHKKTLYVEYLPDSLHQAIYAFILSNAVRDCRGQAHKHHSMLIHVTRFVDVQNEIVEIVDKQVRKIERELEYKTGTMYEKLIKDLKKLYEDDFVTTTNEIKMRLNDNEIVDVAWAEIEPLLYRVVSKIEVKAVNGKAADGGLNYDNYPNGCSVIAIGGNKLSRGLTLEGLSVSYYTRVSKMYDTLLQMGRWFGYRAGYADVCRLYTSGTLVEWYKHLAGVNEEFRRELDAMAELPDVTPATYGLKVRTHPDGMIVTALNKMRNSEKAKVTYSARMVQTTRFYIDNPVNRQNLRYIEGWLNKVNDISSFTEKHGNFVSEGVKPELILEFINNIKIHASCFDMSPGIVSTYINCLNEEGELIEWTVCLNSVKSKQTSGNKEFIYNIQGIGDVGLSWRTDKNNKGNAIKDNYLEVSNRQFISEIDEFIDLDDDEYEKALQDTIEDKNKEVKKPTAKFVRKRRSPKRGLLLIYLFRSGDSEEEHYKDIYTGYALSFPESQKVRDVEYKIDEVYYDQNLLDGE